MKKIKCMPENISPIGGVCGGFAYAFGIDVTLIRILFILGFFAGIGAIGLFYILCWWLFDEWDKVPEDYER